MALEFKRGQPSKLNEELSQKIISNVLGAYTERQIARLSGISHTSLQNYLKWGKRDLEAGEDSMYAQFFARYEQERAKEFKSLVDDIRKTGTIQGLQWLAENAFSDEVGAAAPKANHLLDLLDKLKKQVGDV